MRAYEYVMVAPTTAQMLGHVSDELIKRRVDVEALWMAQQGDLAMCRLVTDDDEKAVAAISAAGFTVSTRREVFVYSFPDRPGILGEISRRATDAGITLTSAYPGAHGNMVLGCDDLAALEDAVVERASGEGI